MIKVELFSSEFYEIYGSKLWQFSCYSMKSADLKQLLRWMYYLKDKLFPGL